METSPRFFRSPWTYFGWFALFLLWVWQGLHPHTRVYRASWPRFSATFNVLSDAWGLCAIAIFARFTSVALEKMALAIIAMSLLLSAIQQVDAIFPFTPLSLRLTFLTFNTLLAFITALRLVQVMREASHPIPTPRQSK